jgi:para-nitrobenzyl esterase
MREATHDDRSGLLVSFDGWIVPEAPAAVFARRAATPVPLMVGSNAVDVVWTTAPPADSAMYGRDTDAVYGPPSSQWSTDAMFRCPAQQVASWHTRVAPTYLYEFQHPPPGHPFTWHNAELNFLWGVWPRDTTGLLMQRYWTNFARGGDPNGPGLPTWPRWTDERRSYAAFTNDGVAIRDGGPRRAFCEHLWGATAADPH